MKPLNDVKVLVVDDNAQILDLLMKGLTPHCDAIAAADGADALLRIVDDPPDLILCDYRMPGLDGRQLYEKLRARQQTKQIPFMFLASRSDVEEKLRPIVEGAEEFVVKPFLLKDLVRRTKKVIDRLHLEKLQKRAVRPGVIQGRLEEMSILDLMQSLEMGQKSCRLTIRHEGEMCQFFLSHRPCFIEASAWETRRASANSSARVCSATLTALPPGVFITTTPFCVAASRSTLSTPVPARPITRRRSALASNCAVTLVALRTISASASMISSATLAPVFFGRNTTSQDSCSRKISTARSETLSATRIFMSIVGSQLSVVSCRTTS